VRAVCTRSDVAGKAQAQSPGEPLAGGSRYTPRDEPFHRQIMLATTATRRSGLPSESSISATVQ
jgi:hypothetical protein